MGIPTSNVAPWAAKYIGLPYVDEGWDRSGAHCYGLLHLIGRTELGFKLPKLDRVTWRTARRHGDWPGFLAQEKEAGWETLWEKRFDNDRPPPRLKVAAGDGILIRNRGIANHCGMVVGAPWFIHAIDEVETSLARYDTDPWKWCIVGFYRWAGERC